MSWIETANELKSGREGSESKARDSQIGDGRWIATSDSGVEVRIWGTNSQEPCACPGECKSGAVVKSKHPP